MAVYYKFKSAKDYDSIPMDGHFMSVANLKERIFESKHLGRGTDFDLVVTNAQTNEEYLDEAMLIPKNTSVLIRRVPGRPRMPIVAQPDELVETKIEETQQINNATAFDSFVLKDLEPPEWDDDFGNDLYATIPEMKAAQVSNPIQDVPAPTKADEDSKIRALIETPALDWQRQAEGFGSGRGSGRGGRMMGGRGIGRGILERKTPPQGYICHRCKVPGHFIQHCPTNGDPNYDIRRVKPPTGIPKSMLMATPDGSYALPSGASAVLRPNEAAFEKEIEGLPTSSRPVGDVPPELRCPLCKDVMKDAVLTSKCCFTSFCDKCIRDHIMSKSMCVCGANDVLADDLLPNKTLRNTINGILEAKDVSGENAGSGIQVPDMESARPRAPSPTLSAASRGDHQIMQPMQSTPAVKDTSKTMDIATEERPSGLSQPGQPQLQLNQLTVEGVRTAKIPDVSEATRESASAREAASQGSAPPPVEEEVQQKMAAAEGKKKKKKKARLPVNSMPMEPQWRNPQDIAAENYMMQQMGPAPYRPYWDGMQQMHQMQQMQQMQPGLESYMQPFPACPMPYNNMGFGMGPMDVPPFGGVFPHDPFMAQNLMFHPPPPFVRPPPQRDLADFGMGFNPRPPLMSREEFEARKADLRRKREMERMGDREMPMNMMTARDRDHGREVSSSTNGPLTKPKLVNRGPPESMHEREQVLDHRHQDSELPNRHSRGGGGGSVHHMERTSPERGGRHLDRISPERGGKRLDRISPERGGNRLDKISPERPRPDPDHLSRKRKSSSDHRSNSHRRSPSIDAFDHRDHRDSSEHHHQRRPRSRSSSKPPSAASEQVPPSHPHTSHKSSSSAEDKLLKKSVFSRISFPEGGVEPANKKRKSSTEPKSSFSKDRVAAASTSSHASVSNGYTRDASPVVTRKSQLSNHSNYIEEVDYESSDDDRHFKRRPSRYEPSPPAPRMVEVAAEMDGGKRSKRDRDRGGHSSRHRS